MTTVNKTLKKEKNIMQPPQTKLGPVYMELCIKIIWSCIWNSCTNKQ